MLTPSPVLPPETADDDLRVGHLLSRSPGSAAIVLVGFPSDEGVRRNGGRPGAAQGPTAIRQALYRLTPGLDNELGSILPRTADLGDVAVTGDVEADQIRLAEAISPHLARGATPIILGGGHETTFGHFLAYTLNNSPIHLWNCDAHADVRPLKNGLGHSGSPFRQAIEHPSKVCRGYTVVGLNPAAVAPSHAAYLKQHGAKWLAADAVKAEPADSIARWSGPTLASFDLDAVNQAEAPGVSAPAATGLSGHEVLRLAHRAGHSPLVLSMDVVELCPPQDRDGATARLAARMIWEFLRGRAVQNANDR